MSEGDRLQLILRVLLEAPNHESYPAEMCGATGLDDDELAPVLECFEDTELVCSRDGLYDRRYYRLTGKGVRLAEFTMRGGGLVIRAERI